MATLATMVNWLFGQADDAPRQMLPADREIFRLRTVANEDIYLYVKRIDNSSVVREADPQSSGACWKLSASAAVAVLLLIGVLLPSAYGLLAGYNIQSLRQEQQRLVTESSTLELEEARMMSPTRLEELARIQSFVDPGPQKVVYLDAPKGSGSLAMNTKAKSIAKQ